jgi:hypothetical protein
MRTLALVFAMLVCCDSLFAQQPREKPKELESLGQYVGDWTTDVTSKPFEGASLPDTITKIRNAEPTKPKEFQLSIPDMFQEVVLRMLAKRAEGRFQTPAILLKVLERVGKFQNVSV